MEWAVDRHSFSFPKCFIMLIETACFLSSRKTTNKLNAWLGFPHAVLQAGMPQLTSLLALVPYRIFEGAGWASVRRCEVYLSRGHTAVCQCKRVAPEQRVAQSHTVSTSFFFLS